MNAEPTTPVNSGDGVPRFILTRYDGNSADATTQARFAVENRTTRMWQNRLDFCKIVRWQIGTKYDWSEARNTGSAGERRFFIESRREHRACGGRRLRFSDLRPYGLFLIVFNISSVIFFQSASFIPLTRSSMLRISFSL